MNLAKFLKRKTKGTIKQVTSNLVSMNEFQTSRVVSVNESEIVRSIVDVGAGHIAKLQGKHIVDDSGTTVNSSIQKLFSVRPNPLMTPYDFLYKVASHWLLYNNAWIWIERNESGEVVALWPLTVSSLELLKDEFGQIIVRFTHRDGSIDYVSYNDLIHLRRQFSESEALGDDNSPLNAVINLAQVADDGIKAGINNCSHLKGILRIQAVTTSEKETAEKFKSDFLGTDNAGGVAVLDQSAEFTPLTQQPYPVDTELIESIRRKACDYFHISPKIVSGNFTESEYQSFFETIVEPFGLSLSQEVTSKLFSPKEIAYGNKIIFENSITNYMSYNTKASYIRELMPLGLLTRNEARNIMNMPPVSDDEGDKYIQTLNVVDTSLAKDYQSGKAGLSNEELNHEDSKNSST